MNKPTKDRQPRDCVNRVLAFLSKATDAAARGESVQDVDIRLLRMSKAANKVIGGKS